MGADLCVTIIRCKPLRNRSTVGLRRMLLWNYYESDCMFFRNTKSALNGLTSLLKAAINGWQSNAMAIIGTVRNNMKRIWNGSGSWSGAAGNFSVSDNRNFTPTKYLVWNRYGSC